MTLHRGNKSTSTSEGSLGSSSSRMSTEKDNSTSETDTETVEMEHKCHEDPTESVDQSENDSWTQMKIGIF